MEAKLKVYRLFSLLFGVGVSKFRAISRAQIEEQVKKVDQNLDPSSRSEACATTEFLGPSIFNTTPN